MAPLPERRQAPPTSGARALLREVARREAERSERPRRHRTLVALSCATGVAMALWLPGPLGPQERGDLTVYGGPLVELAFTAAVLSAVLFAFRTMDVLYRFAGLQPLRSLPLRARVIAQDRALVLAREACVGALLLALPFVLCLPRAPAHALGAAAMAALGPLLAVLVALGTNVIAGLPGLGPRTGEKRPPGGAAALTGEVAGAWHLAPGIAFAATAALLLLAKLGIEELIRPLYVNGLPAVPRAAIVALGLALIPALAVALRGYLALARHAHALLARFEEGDIAQRDGALVDDATPLTPRGGLPGTLRPAVALLLRMNLRLLERARPFLRAGTLALAAVLLFARWAQPDALPALGWAAVAATWILLVLRPDATLRRLDGDLPEAPSAALAGSIDRRAARALAAFGEITASAALLSLPLLLTGGDPTDRLRETAAVWLAVLAAHGWRRARGARTGPGVEAGEVIAALTGLGAAAALHALHPALGVAGAVATMVGLTLAQLLPLRERAADPARASSREAHSTAASPPEGDAPGPR